MNWIKKNPAQFGLAVVSVLLLASAYFLYAGYSEFPTVFEESQRAPSPNKEVPPLETKVIDTATQAVTAPGTWTPSKSRLFAGKLYVAKEGQLKQPVQEGGEPFNPPVPNVWLLNHGLDLLNPAVLSEDPDRDGFSTRLEWDGMDAISHMSETPPYGPASGPDGKPLPDDATNPVDANSHPPYHTRLSLVQVVNIPFRLRFMSYDINPRNPADITVGINTVDRGGRTHFKAIGEDIPGTKFKVEKFEKKEAPGADGTKTDVSILTVYNKEKDERLDLPLNRMVDSPDSYVVLHYGWAPAGGQPVPDINKQKGGTFTIPPETDKTYKVLDIKQDEVEIELPSKEKRILRKGK
jgi:hypothetical protein